MSGASWAPVEVSCAAAAAGAVADAVLEESAGCAGAVSVPLLARPGRASRVGVAAAAAGCLAGVGAGRAAGWAGGGPERAPRARSLGRVARRRRRRVARRRGAAVGHGHRRRVGGRRRPHRSCPCRPRRGRGRHRTQRAGRRSSRTAAVQWMQRSHGASLSGDGGDRGPVPGLILVFLKMRSAGESSGDPRHPVPPRFRSDLSSTLWTNRRAAR